MSEEIGILNSHLKNQEYNLATKVFKKMINASTELKNQESIIEVIKREMLFLNLSGDSNKTRLFCEKIMRFCEITLANPDLDIYISQCRILNEELDFYGNQSNNLIRKLYALDASTALHLILSVFENYNQNILNENLNEMEQYHYFLYVYGKETTYESNISALNRLLELWLKGVRRNYFKGKYKDLTNLKRINREFENEIETTSKSLNYLEWLCKQISIHNVSMDSSNEEVIFTVKSYNEYRKFKLPSIRDTARMQSTLITSKKNQLSNFSDRKIDYEKVLKVKKDENDFKLEIDNESFSVALERSVKSAYESHLLIFEEVYINKMEEIVIRDKSTNALELFMFYYCLNSLAIIYFEATQYFITINQIIPKAPYLAINKVQLYELFRPILSRSFKRKVTVKEFDELIEVFNFGQNDINDLYYKPLLVEGERVIIIPSIFLMNNFTKTFPHHLNQLKVNLSDRGEIFEEVIQSLFTKHNFKVHKGKYPYSYLFENVIENGDIDLIAQKGEYLFLGQLKNRIEPMEPRDYRGADKKIKQAVKQVRASKSYIERNSDEFCKRFHITPEELEGLVIVPFVLLSCYYGSGQILEGIPVIDDSALFKFLEDGEIKATIGEDKHFSRALRTSGDVIPEEFIDFLNKPYFLESNIYGIQMATKHASFIRNKGFYFNTDNAWDNIYSQSFFAEATNHFIRNGSINIRNGSIK